MSFEENREALVKNLILEKRILSEQVKNAFLKTPRELFLPDSLKKYAYADTPLQIGKGQTISAPHMVAIMCEELDIKEGQKIAKNYTWDKVGKRLIKVYHKFLSET